MIDVKDLAHEAPNGLLLAVCLWKVSGLEAQQRLILAALKIPQPPARRVRGILGLFALAFGLALLPGVLTGCTYAKAPGGWKYVTVGTARHVDSVTLGTNGVLRVKGATSDPSESFRAFGEGLGAGLKK
jgi:hypothetical protein